MSQVMEKIWRGPLKSGSDILKAEWHDPISEGSPQTNEHSIKLIIMMDKNLVVSGETIHEG